MRSGRTGNRARPVLEFDQPLQMRIASLLVFDVIERKTGNLQHIDAGEPRIRLGDEHASDRERERLAKRLMARLEIDRGQDDRCVGEMACQCTALPRRLIACLP